MTSQDCSFGGGICDFDHVMGKTETAFRLWTQVGISPNVVDVEL